MLPEAIDPGEDGEKPTLPQDENGYYEIASAEDLAVISQFPEENYVLTSDMVLTQSMSPLCRELQFMGILDGAGHKITGYISTEGGLIHTNAGTIRNLGMEDASVQAPGASNIGILCDTNGGIIESCYTTGSVSGQGDDGRRRRVSQRHHPRLLLDGQCKEQRPPGRRRRRHLRAGQHHSTVLCDRLGFGGRQRRRHHRLYLCDHQRGRQFCPEHFGNRPHAVRAPGGRQDAGE